MNAIFGDQFYWRYRLKIPQNLNQLWVLRICFSQLFQDTFSGWNTHWGTSMVKLIKPSCQEKTGTQKLLFHFITE